MNNKLTGQQRQELDSVFWHPLTHNLEWAKVNSLFRAMGKVEDQDSGKVKVTSNGHSLSLRTHKDGGVFDMSALLDVRHFVRDSESKEGPWAPLGDHLLVVIAHSEARIFRSILRGSPAVPPMVQAK